MTSKEPSSRVAQEAKKLEALSQPGSEHYVGLERFPNPGCRVVTMASDEFTAVCPITGQPDWYTVEIEYKPENWCLESKSLKLYLVRYRNEGAFCETLAVQIRDETADVLDVGRENVQVTLAQKARGGISITAVA
jgi:7-cyano-7-deazaguanine reductase